MSDSFRQPRDFQIIKPANESAFEALGEEFSEHGSCYSGSGIRESVLESGYS